MREEPSIRRLLTLRQFPGFADAELADIATVAENLVERTYAPGEVIAPAGRVSAIHLVVAGRLQHGARTYGPHQAFGAFEVIAGRRTAAPAVAAVETRTLQLAASELAEVLEDSYSVLASARRMLARRMLALDLRRSDVIAPAVLRVEDELGPETLGMVDRLILLRQQMAFAAGRAQALAALAQATQDVRIPRGTVLARRGELATRSMILLGGAVRGDRGDGVITLYGPGDGVGGLEVLAETSHTHTYETLTPVRAIECPAAALFDVMEDHTDFALGMLSKLAGALVDADTAARDGAN